MDLYFFPESDPAGPSKGSGGGNPGPGGNNTNSNGSRATLENMTFYVRGCLEDKRTRESCEVLQIR